MKLKMIAAIAICAIALTACGGGEESTAPSSAPQSESQSAAAEETPAPDPADSADQTQADGPSFADNVLTMDDYTITITDYKVIQPGETGNEYGDVPVIAFWYDTTNISNEDGLNPMTAWILAFEAVQDNDPNAVNTLEVGMLPDQQFLDSQMEEIKVGGTVSNAIAYELDDTTTPVTLTAQDIMGTEYGSQEFAIAE